MSVEQKSRVSEDGRIEGPVVGFYRAVSQKATAALVLILVSSLGLIFIRETQTTPQFEDSIGYLYAGQRIAEGEGPSYEDPNNLLAGPFFTLSAFQIQGDDGEHMFLGFPPGYPLLIALAVTVSGMAEVAHYVVPIMAIIGVLLTYLFSRILTGSAWVGFWAAALLGFSAAYWEFSTAAWSEIPATVFMLAGICLYLLANRDKTPRQYVILFSMVGAAALGYSFFIRYANLAVLPAIFFYELFSRGTGLLRQRDRWPFFFILGASLLAIILFNSAYYGGPFMTSYSPIHGWYPHAPFSLSYAFGPSFVDGFSFLEAIRTLWANFPILLLVVPAGWLLLPRPAGILAAAGTFGFLLLYSTYAFAPVGVNSRFLLSTFPFISVSIAQVIFRAGKRIPQIKMRRFAGILLLGLLCLVLPKQLEGLESRNHSSESTMMLAKQLAQETEQDAVLLSYVHNDRIAYYGDRSVLNYRRIPISDPEEGRYRLEMLEPCLVVSVGRLVSEEIPVYYVLDQSPSFWNSFEILDSHFEVELVSDSPDVYRLLPADMGESDDNLPACQRLAVGTKAPAGR